MGTPGQQEAGHLEREGVVEARLALALKRLHQG